MSNLLSRVIAAPHETARSTGPEAHSRSGPAVWTPPALVELPRLADLTLQTGAPISGGGSGSGGVTFP